MGMVIKFQMLKRGEREGNCDNNSRLAESISIVRTVRNVSGFFVNIIVRARLDLLIWRTV